jgi:hypothetical protein
LTVHAPLFARCDAGVAQAVVTKTTTHPATQAAAHAPAYAAVAHSTADPCGWAAAWSATTRTAAVLGERGHGDDCCTSKCTEDHFAKHCPNLLLNRAKMPRAQRSARAAVR